MTFDEYQTRAEETALYPSDKGKSYTVLGLANEAGEVAGKYKKFLRGDYDRITDNNELARLRDDIRKELGDVLWYAAMVAKEFDLSLNDVATTNLEKLHKRKEDQTIMGSGDNR